jgi:type IV secretory pathway VirB10-like protein
VCDSQKRQVQAKLRTMNFLRFTLPHLVAIFGLVFTASATAQYMWLDASGRKVFSDQPPPANIPAKRVLQQPGKATAPQSTAVSEKPSIEAGSDEAKSATAPKAPATAAKPETSKDKDLEAAKKKLEDEAAVKKKAEQEKVDAAKADNCKRAKSAKSQFETGRPVATANAKGERIIMDEAARMVEAKRLEGIIASDCK